MQSLNGQKRVDVSTKVEKEADKRLNKMADNVIDKTFDKVEEDVDDAVSDSGNKNEKTSNKQKSGETTTNSVQVEDEARPKSEPPLNPQDADQSPMLTWNKYDFVPGTEIIFEDNFENEQNGEFPSRWDITKGVVENAVWGDENVVFFRKTNANGPDAILPLLENRSEDYLPDEFTVEFDVYFHKDYKLNSVYYLFFYDSKNQIHIISPSKPVKINFNSLKQNNIGDEYPGRDVSKPVEGWCHIAFSFNKRSLKGYLDDTRLLNIPNCDFNPTGIMLTAHNVSSTAKPFIKNVRIAKGAVPLYDKVLSEGRFVTTGIKFDVNKATIKSESSGTFNYVFKMMTDYPTLKFLIEGHTDSDGDENLNLKLSEDRANAVSKKLVEMGIPADRLTTKGFGESKPMAGNETAEGKALNRRVEFVKQ